MLMINMTKVVCNKCKAVNEFVDDVCCGFKCKKCGHENEDDYEFV